MNNIKIDEFLEVTKNMELLDIKNLCKTNTNIFNLCTEYKHLIFKNIVYILQYTTQLASGHELIIINKIYKDINHAIEEMNRKYNIQLNILNKKSNEDSRYTFSFHSGKFKSIIEEDNAEDNDQTYIWKIKAYKVLD